ncbi:MAG: ribonuclease J [Bacilli bacterium]|nr:ribonuclease J [Bacilli bacterium]
MSKIKIFALGGLDEDGKNTYCIDINNNIFIFDCGLKYANENLYGIDYITADFSYLEKNKKRIKGVFITHGHYENMGAVKDLVNTIKNIRIFATKYTKKILIFDGVNEDNIYEIIPHKKLVFGDISIFPINVNHSCPDAVMFVINTPDGAICYTGDFLIDPAMSGNFDMDLGRIAYVGKQGVLALLSESPFSEKNGFTSPNHRLKEFFKDTINRNKERIIFLVLPSNIYALQEILDGVVNTHRKVLLMGKKLQYVLKMGKEEGYLTYDDNIIGDLSNVNDADSIIIVSDERDNQYGSISKILNGYDKFIKLKNTDTIVFAEPKYDSTEKVLVKVQNDLAEAGCNIINIPKDKTLLYHASSEDLLLMLKLLNPKYYIPVRGEYRYMVNNANLVNSIGFSAENIILKQNGDVIEIEDGNLLDTYEHIKVNDILIDGNSSDDVGDLVIKDRQMLSENGIVLISATIDKNNKKILVEPKITTRGFIYVKDSAEMIKEIQNISLEVIERNITSNYVDFNNIKNEIREDLGRYLYQETECKPMIIAVIQEVEV